MRNFIVFVLLSVTTYNAYAQKSDRPLSTDRLDDKEINFLYNILTGSQNPVSLSFNTVQTLTRATVNTHFTRGDLHALDESSRYNDFSFNIAGLKQIGRLSLSGDLTYVNSKAYDHRWNNTLMLTPTNPFILADSVPGDATEERFAMHAAASLPLSETLTGALKLQFATSNMSDQTDPRPKVNAMHFVVNPGIIFRTNKRHSVGIAGEIDIYRSDIIHTVVNNLEVNQYFLMKGMGDNLTFTTNSNIQYPRDYAGTRITGSAQWQTQAERFGNLLEASFSTNSENAEDGGSAYTYKGGDYSAKRLALYERLSFNTANAFLHQFIVRAAWTGDQGYWYDQKRLVDTEHGNKIYYQILNKSKVHNATHTNAQLEYRIDRRQAIDQPMWAASVRGGIASQKITHYEAESYKQQYNMIDLAVMFTKYWRLKKCRLSTLIGGFYVSRIGTPTYTPVRDKLVDSYSAPMFEYATASRTGLDIRMAADMPLHIYGTPSWTTVYIQSRNIFYTGNNAVSKLYKGTSQTVIDAGISLTL